MSSPALLPPATIRARIEEALHALARRPRTPGLESYEEDRVRFLTSAERVGEPRLVHAEGVPVRYATPLFWGERVGGIVASEPHTGEVLSWPAWAPGPRPLFAYTVEDLERFIAQSDPRVGEVVPQQLRTPTRFSVDPARVEGAYLLERYDALPFKNQEERYAWVEEVNRSGRMRTRWRHKTGYQEPSFKCLSYAASTVVDWWGLMHGVTPSASYQSFVNGSQEYGVNPRELEVLYYHRARRIGGRFYRLAPRLPPTLDPVTRERIAASSVAFARLICSPDEIDLPDPLTRDGRPLYRFRRGMWHMDGPPRTLFAKGKGDPAAIREALHRHGIVLAFTQARFLRVIRIGLHGIPIVGYFRRGKETLFIYHESYGNHGPGYVWDDGGGPCYMTIPAHMLREASCFPHRLWIDAEPAGEGLAIRITHSGGGALDTPPPMVHHGGGARAATAVAGGWIAPPPPQTGTITITVDREYFRGEDGKPVSVTMPWGGADAAAVAVARWRRAARQLEPRGPAHHPPHLTARLAALERELVELARRPGFRLETLAPLSRVVSDRDVTLLQGALLPRLLAAGLPPEIARRVMA
jgi:hypothetical protein